MCLKKVSRGYKKKKIKNGYLAGCGIGVPWRRRFSIFYLLCLVFLCSVSRKKIDDLNDVYGQLKRAVLYSVIIVWLRWDGEMWYRNVIIILLTYQLSLQCYYYNYVLSRRSKKSDRVNKNILVSVIASSLTQAVEISYIGTIYNASAHFGSLSGIYTLCRNH